MSLRDFIIRRWTISVQGYGEAIELAPTRGKALASAWRCDAFGHLTFGQFLGIARARLSPTVPPTFGASITVEGKPAFYVEHNRQYVQFAWPGGEFVLNAHPYDVEPPSFRPLEYQDRAA